MGMATTIFTAVSIQVGTYYAQANKPNERTNLDFWFQLSSSSSASSRVLSSCCLLCAAAPGQHVPGEGPVPLPERPPGAPTHTPFREKKKLDFSKAILISTSRSVFEIHGEISTPSAVSTSNKNKKRSTNRGEVGRKLHIGTGGLDFHRVNFDIFEDGCTTPFTASPSGTCVQQVIP